MRFASKKIAVLNSTDMESLIDAAPTERRRAAVALAGLAGLRLGERRGLRWEDVDLDENTISVVRSLLPDGSPVPPKSERVAAPSRCSRRSGVGSSSGRFARLGRMPSTT